MMAQGKTLILFDIDGTLLLSGGAGNRSIDKAFYRLYSVERATQGIAFVGRTDTLIFEEIVREKMSVSVTRDMRENIQKTYLEFFKDEVITSPGFRVLVGVQELLGELSRDQNFILGIATGNLREGARIKLKHAGLSKYFSFGGYDEDGLKRSGIVSKAIGRARQEQAEAFKKIFLVGDSPYDVMAARETGIISIAVGSDGEDKYGLQQIPSDYFFSTLENVSEFMRIVYVYEQ